MSSTGNKKQSCLAINSVILALTTSLCISTAFASPTVTDTGTANKTDPFDKYLDLLQINYDATFDPDDYHAAPALGMLLDYHGVDAVVVGGAVSPWRSWGDGTPGNKGKFDTAYLDPADHHQYKTWNLLFGMPNNGGACDVVAYNCHPGVQGQTVWLNAMTGWSDKSPDAKYSNGGNITLASSSPVVIELADMWYDTLCPAGGCNINDFTAAGGWEVEADVWIADGGQGDITLHVAKYAATRGDGKKLPKALMNERVHAVQHHTSYNMCLSGGNLSTDSYKNGAQCDSNSENNVYGKYNSYSTAPRDGSEPSKGSVAYETLQDYVNVRLIKDGNGEGAYHTKTNGGDGQKFDPTGNFNGAMDSGDYFFIGATTLTELGTLDRASELVTAWYWVVDEIQRPNSTNLPDPNGNGNTCGNGYDTSDADCYGTYQYYADFSDTIEVTWILDNHDEIEALGGYKPFIDRYNGIYLETAGGWLESFPSTESANSGTTTEKQLPSNVTASKFKYCLNNSVNSNVEVFELLAWDENNSPINWSSEQATASPTEGTNWGDPASRAINGLTTANNNWEAARAWNHGVDEWACILVEVPTPITVSKVGINEDNSGSQVSNFYVEHWDASPLGNEIGRKIGAASFYQESHPSNNANIQKESDNSVGNTKDGNWIKFTGLDLEGADVFEIFAANGSVQDGTLKVMLGGENGTEIGSVKVLGTANDPLASWTNYRRAKPIMLSQTVGSEDTVALVFETSATHAMKLKHFTFRSSKVSTKPSVNGKTVAATTWTEESSPASDASIKNEQSNVASIDANSWVRFNGINVGEGNKIQITASRAASGTAVVHVYSEDVGPNGSYHGNFTVSSTGSLNSYSQFPAAPFELWEPLWGENVDLYFVFDGDINFKDFTMTE